MDVYMIGKIEKFIKTKVFIIRKVRNMKFLNTNESSNIGTETMPKEMSDWIDSRVNSGEYAKVEGRDGKELQHGYAMKSRDCTVLVFPNWNCDQQFKKIVNKLR